MLKDIIVSIESFILDNLTLGGFHGPSLNVIKIDTLTVSGEKKRSSVFFHSLARTIHEIIFNI